MGKIIEFNRKKVVEDTKERAVLENIETQYKYAQMYLYGIDGEVNIEEGIRFLKEAADNGHSDAKCHLGTYYYNGEILNRDYNKAVELFEMAKESNNPKAYIFLGFAYMHGKGGKDKNNNKAYNCFKKAHGLGECIGTYYLGDCYFKGIGVEKDLFKALDFYAKALENGYIYDTKSLLLCLKESISKYQYYEEEISNGNGSEYSNLINIRKKIKVFAKFINLLKLNIN